ncbi:MAG: PH domain-containing protein [Bacilli bacterium]
MAKVYDLVMEFKKKYPKSITWLRLKQHSAIVEKHLNPGEEVVFAFPGQKNDSVVDIYSTCVVAVTNKRILIGQKRLVFGYFLYSITPDLFNDLSVYQGLIFGKVTIDTIKEVVTLTNLDKNSLTEIETKVTTFMMEEKKKYPIRSE